MEQYIVIELLWIIPIVGFGVFVSILVFLLHSKFSSDTDPDMKRQVKEFNNGSHHIPAAPKTEESALELEKRLSELEGAISSLTKSIAVHQKSVENMNAAGADDNPELTRMLEAMRREYDAILHENRTLRTQFMTFLSDEGKLPKVSSQTKTNLRVFEDTRSLSIDNFEDTSDLELTSGN